MNSYTYKKRRKHIWRKRESAKIKERVTNEKGSLGVRNYPGRRASSAVRGEETGNNEDKTWLRNTFEAEGITGERDTSVLFISRRCRRDLDDVF